MVITKAYSLRLCALVALNLAAIAALLYPRSPVPLPSSDAYLTNPLVALTESSPYNLSLERLTWMEVRDQIKRGHSRVIIPTGGIEQNGPFVALNKHDVIGKRLSIEIATRLGSTLVAPIVSFVPQGSINPPTSHMRFAGTLSVSEETFVRLLVDIGLSCAAHGFKEIIILGDSLGSQEGMKRAASTINASISNPAARAIFVESFYDYPATRALLAARNIPQLPETFHEELAFTAQLAAIDPSAIRYNERLKAGFTTLGGVAITDLKALQALGELIISTRADRATQAIKILLTDQKNTP
jgi:creatinine amidohydrolase